MDKLDINSTELERASITNEDQARNWVESLINEMLVWRARCDVIIPDNTQETVVSQRRAMWTFLSKNGKVCGALSALKLCGLISDRCYTELNQKATNTLIPTQVGVR